MKTRMNRLMTICAVAGLILAVNVVTQAQDFTWTYKTPMIHGRAFAGAGAAVVDQMIYTIAGHEGSLYGRYNEAYDTSTDTWTSKAALCHGDGRYAISTIAVNGKVYTFCGSNIWGNYNNNNIDEYGDCSINTGIFNDI